MSRIPRRTHRPAPLPRLTLIVAMLLVVMPGVVNAASPTITNDIVLIAACGRMSGPDGTLDLGLSVPRDREADAMLTYWAPGADPDADDPVFIGGAGFTLRQASPTRIEGDLHVSRVNSEEEFMAPISLDFASAGEPELFSVEDRFGNVTTRMTFG